jgi:hypothetical protein
VVAYPWEWAADVERHVLREALGQNLLVAGKGRLRHAVDDHHVRMLAHHFLHPIDATMTPPTVGTGFAQNIGRIKEIV